MSVPETAKAAFLRQPPAAQLAILFDAYTDLLGWQELWEVMRANAPHLQLLRMARGAPYDATATPKGLQEQMRQLRKVFLQVLAWLPEEHWLPVETVLPLLVRLTPVFEAGWQQMNYYGYAQQWHFAWDRRRLGKKPEDWSQLQGAAFGIMLLGPLAWFGLVDLQLTANDLTHFRLHGLAHLLRGSAPAIDLDRPVPGMAPAIAVTAPPTVEGDAIHLKTLAGNGTLLLEKIAHPQSVKLNNIVYQLDVARVHRTFEGGATVGALLAEWERCFGAPPDTLRTRLESWWQGYGAVRLYQKLTLIEFGDDYALREMRMVTPLDEVLLVELSPRTVLIPAAAVDRLLKALQKAGYTPKLTDGVE